MLIVLAGEEQRFELAIQALAVCEAGLAEGHGKQGADPYVRRHHADTPSCPGATKRARTVSNISSPRERIRATS